MSMFDDLKKTGLFPSNVSVNKDGITNLPDNRLPRQRRSLTPFGLFDPFDDLDLFDRRMFSENDFRMFKHMRTDIYEKDGVITATMEIPGCKKEDIKITTQNGYLTITATKSNTNEDENHENSCVSCERVYGKFVRTFDTSAIDESTIKAKYENGILTITANKKEKEIPEKNEIVIE